MARRGWRVYQLGLGGASEGESSVGRLNGVVLVRWRRRRYRGARLARYLRAYAGFWFWARALLRRIERRHRIRVVHVNNVPNWMVWAAGRAQRRGAAVILDIHDPEPELFLSKFSARPGAPLVARALRWEERLASRAADVVLCVHEPHRELTTAHGVDGRKISVIENFPDARLFPLQAPRAAFPFVAYHGTVAGRMGLELLLGAAQLLRAEGRPLAGAIWGDGDAVPALRRIRDELGLTANFEIGGQRVPLEELVRRLERVGVGVGLLQRDAFTDIMLPTKVLEYVRLGIPVVTAWTPTMAYYFPEDTLHYVRDLSPAGVATAVRQVLEAPERARERAERAQRLAVARSWQDREPDFFRIVLEVARCHKPVHR